ncbi:hypothetical protein MferCBS49748_001310 [Microsporum ferrugineum]
MRMLSGDSSVSYCLANPSFTKDDLDAFHAKHFATHDFNQTIASNFFSGCFSTTEVQATGYEDLYDDGLGYYPDGVKRTLTDQQIQIFRHSEIQGLLRQKKLEEEALDSGKGANEYLTEDDAREQANVTSLNQKKTDEKRVQAKLLKQRKDINGRTGAASSSTKRPIPKDVNDHGTPRQETKRTPKSPAQFRRRIVSYEDA